SASSVAAAPAESIEAMRKRARHRLVGAAVLVLVGVIGFPLLFDTQPRPIDVDIPIEIPDRTKAKPLALPSTPPPTAAGAPVVVGSVEQGTAAQEVAAPGPVGGADAQPQDKVGAASTPVPAR